MTSISSVTALDTQLLQKQTNQPPSTSGADHDRDHDIEATENAATKAQEKTQSGALNIIA